MTKRFEFAYNALVKAFFDGTLAKGDCGACAVGNIVAAGQGSNVILIRNIFDNRLCSSCETNNHYWVELFVTTKTNIQRFNQCNHPDDFIRSLSDILLKETGYTSEELAKVEFAFETNTRISIGKYGVYSEQAILEDQYNGLCAVVDVLLQLNNEAPDEAYKAKFREHPKLVMYD